MKLNLKSAFLLLAISNVWCSMALGCKCLHFICTLSQIKLLKRFLNLGEAVGSRLNVSLASKNVLTDLLIRIFQLGNCWLYRWRIASVSEWFSCCGFHSQMLSLESQHSEMVNGKQMSSCLRDSIFPLPYILLKGSACLPGLLSAFITNEFPNAINVIC